MIMATSKLSKPHQLALSVKLDIPSTVVHVNQRHIEEAIRIIFKNNPQALNVNSPEEVLQKLGFDTPQKGKWTDFIERLEQHTMGEEAGLAFDEGRKEFRDHFVMTNPFSDNNEKIFV
jgi:hypothetical protein